MTSILPPSSPEAKIAAEMIASGKFVDEREVIAQGVRTLAIVEQRRAALNSALQAGLESGVATNFDPDQFLAQMHKKYGVDE